ncbi:MAG TPA: ammonium transporter [Candidatus Marinimicrobia bacterium]|nr:ammonium transporter [Candidatus Neomarinimicrobiota bacterium]
MKRFLFFLILILGLATVTFAQDGGSAGVNALDTVWVLLTAFLVFWMQAGFAMVEAGMTRAKNVVNILMKNLLDFCFSTIVFWAVGFGIMFGAGNLFFGTSGWFLKDLTGDTFGSLAWTNVPIEAKYFFQLVFAGTAATIVSGAMAERTVFVSYMFYSIFISAIIYPVAGHWIWGGGWLAQLGMWDFAGSTVVHSVGGWMALVGAIMVGPRLGKYRRDGSPNLMMGHNFGLATLGTFILWLGWFGFNPGSTMAAVPDAISHIAVTTNLGAATGAIVALVTSKLLFKKWDGSMALNGTLAGLVAITAPCAFVSNSSAVIIGSIAGILVVLSVIFIDKKCKVDDPVGAISVHLTNGIWGTLALGLFAQDKFSPNTTGDGLFFGGGFDLLFHQAIGVLSVGAWCIATGFALFFLLKKTSGLRVSREEEIRGLDVDEHGMEGYPDFQGFLTK